MNGEDLLIGQIGLILTQTSQVRRTLEDIERAISRYSGIAFSGVLSGAHFGEPPILEGALKVYVVNIGELAPGGGIGGFFANLLGGVGGFFGGLIGGIPGGFLGGLALPYNLAQLRRIVEALRPIVDAVDAMMQRMGPSTGPSWLDHLPELTELVRALTLVLPPLTDLVRALGESLPNLVDPITRLYNLFRAPTSAAATPTPSTPEPALDYVALLRELTGLVNGLVLLIPELVVGLAVIIVHLSDIRRGITDMLTWALRMVFLLRGAVLVVLFDTLAEGARMGAKVLGVLATAVDGILTAVFQAIEGSLSAALQLLRVFSEGLSGVLQTLVTWLIVNLGNALLFLGRLPIFQLVFRIADALHMAIQMMTGTTPTPLPAVPAGPSGTVTPPLPGPLALGDQLSQTRLDDATTKFSAATKKSTDDIKGALDKAINALTGLEATGRQRETGAAAGSTELNDALARVDTRAQTLAGALDEAHTRELETPQKKSGLETVAQAYELWLKAGGMGTLLDQLTHYFERTPTTGAAASTSLLGRLFDALVGGADAGMATVEIDEMVVEVAAPAAGAAGSGDGFGDDAPITFRRLKEIALGNGQTDMRNFFAWEGIS